MKKKFGLSLLVLLVCVMAMSVAVYAGNVNVTFDLNGGGSVSPTSKSVTVGSTYGTLPTPTRTGYTFNGWYTSSGSAGTKVTSSTKVQASMNHKIYAHWTQKTYTVSFNSNGGSSVSSKTVGYGNSVGSLTTPSKTGYSFQGWYTSSSGGSKISSSTVITSSVTYYAHWSAASYTVTFNGNGGTSTSRTVTYNNSIGTLPSSNRDGYTFNGWYTAASGGSSISSSTTITGNVTYYAHWTQKVYTVAFDSRGGGSFSPQNVVHGGHPTLPTPSKTGYTFQGWYTAASGGSKFTSDAVYSSMTLYAHWAVASYTVTFNGNGGTSTSRTVTYNNSVGTLPSSTRDGYTFNGWYTSASGGSSISSSTTITGNVTYYAHWTQKVYTVAFDSQGGGSFTPQNVVHGGHPTLPTPSKTGYSFQGWYTAASGGSKFTSDAVYSSMTLYAHWSINQYTVTFNSTGGSAVSSKTVNHGSAIGTLPVTTRSGYTFLGWYSATSGGVQVTTGTVISNNITLYAQWKQNICTVSFDVNGGNGQQYMSNKSLEWGSAFGDNLYSAPGAPAGKYFVGWFDDASAGNQYTSSSIVPSQSSLKLYAHYATVKYTVTFYGNGATSGSTAGFTCEYGKSYTLPGNGFVYTNHTFAGWNTTKDGSGISYADGASIINLSNTNNATVTLYAQWKQNYCKVTFDANGGNGQQYLSNKSLAWGTKFGGDLYSAPGAPAGKYFVGWFNDASAGKQYTEDSIVPSQSNLTLYAHYEYNSYTIVYDGNGQTNGMMKNTQAKYNESVKLSDNAYIKDNHVFTGWNTKADGSGTSYKDGAYVKNLTMSKDGIVHLYAQWKEKEYVISFDVNGGYGEQFIGGEHLYLKKGDAYGHLPAGPTPVTGHEFAGWFTAKSGGTKIEEDSIFNGTSDQTLYAQYTKKQYTVKFDVNGGYGEQYVGGISITVTYGEPYGKLPSAPTHPDLGYTFSGWATSDGIVVTEETIVSIAANHTLYASWNGNTHTVKFDVNGGYGEQFVGAESRQVRYGGTYPDLPAFPVKPGYTCIGWYTETNQHVEKGSICTIDADHTLKAKWQANSYTIYFDGNGASGAMSPITVKYDEDVTLPAQTFKWNKNGEYFYAWTDASTDGKTICFDGATVRNLTTSDKITLYARWRPGYQISFNSNGGDITPDPVIKWKGVDLYLGGSQYTPQQYGATFEGWGYVGAAGVFTVIEPGGFLREDIETTLIAQWLPTDIPADDECVITYRENSNGQFIGTETVKFGEKMTFVPEDIDGMEFAGWVVDGGYGAGILGIDYRPGDIVTTKMTDNKNYLTLYGLWDKVEHDDGMVWIHFDPCGGTNAPNVQKVDPKALSFELTTEVPTRNGYSFEGWSEDTFTLSDGNFSSGRVDYLPGDTVETDWLTGFALGDVFFYAVWKTDNLNDVQTALYNKYGSEPFKDYMFNQDYETTTWQCIDKNTYYALKTESSNVSYVDNNSSRTIFNTKAAVIRFDGGEWTIETYGFNSGSVFDFYGGVFDSMKIKVLENNPNGLGSLLAAGIGAGEVVYNAAVSFLFPELAIPGAIYDSAEFVYNIYDYIASFADDMKNADNLLGEIAWKVINDPAQLIYDEVSLRSEIGDIDVGMYGFKENGKVKVVLDKISTNGGKTVINVKDIPDLKVADLEISYLDIAGFLIETGQSFIATGSYAKKNLDPVLNYDAAFGTLMKEMKEYGFGAGIRNDLINAEKKIYANYLPQKKLPVYTWDYDAIMQKVNNMQNEATPTPTPTVAPITTPTITPAPTQAPEVTPMSVITQVPVVTSTPVITKAPVVTSTPIITQAPVITPTPVITQSPVVTPTPVITQAPVVTSTPVITQAPVVTPMPVITQAPVVTPTPVITQAPVVTSTPVITQTPVVTEAPDNGKDPSTTPAPTDKPSTTPTSGPSKTVTEIEVDDKISENILTEEEQVAVENGAGVKVEAEAEEVKTTKSDKKTANSASSDIKQQIVESGIASKKKVNNTELVVSQTYDIDITKQIGDGQKTEVSGIKDGSVTVTVPISDNLIKTSAKESRVYYMVTKDENGKAVATEAKLNKDGSTLTFESQGSGKATLVYADMPYFAAEGTVLKTSNALNAVYVVTTPGNVNGKVGEVSFVDTQTDKANVTIKKSVKIDGIKYNVTGIADREYENNKKLKKVTISNNIESIGENAFAGCSNLKTIVINSTKLTAGNVDASAFDGISKNAVVKVPKGYAKKYKAMFKKLGINVKVKAQ